MHDLSRRIKQFRCRCSSSVVDRGWSNWSRSVLSSHLRRSAHHGVEETIRQYRRLAYVSIIIVTVMHNRRLLEMTVGGERFPLHNTAVPALESWRPPPTGASHRPLPRGPSPPPSPSPRPLPWDLTVVFGAQIQL